MTLAVNIAQTIAVMGTAVVAIVALQRSRRDRQADVRRARLERLIDEIVRYVDAVAAASGQWGQGIVLDAARARLEAALLVAGGEKEWRSTGILLRVPNESVADQSKAALLEVTAAITAAP